MARSAQRNEILKFVLPEKPATGDVMHHIGSAATSRHPALAPAAVAFKNAVALYGEHSVRFGLLLRALPNRGAFHFFISGVI